MLSGTINDENGQPLPGASVLLKGTTRGTNTNADGQFSLNVNGAGTLILSTVGYTSKEIPFTASQTTITTDLDADVRSLGEVVVTALGISKEEKTLSYATQQIETKTFAKAKELNVANSLIGRVAGLDVARSASGPGSSSRIVLRGDRSISGNNQALIVVDGVPMDNSNFSPGNANGGRDGGDGLSSVNPDDIEAMNILRGAAATALYGSRASNGAILITTKTGTSRRGIGISVNSSFMAEQPMFLRKLQNEYGQGSAGQYSPRSEFSWGPKITGQPVQLWGPDPASQGQTYNMTPQPNNYEDFYSTGSQISNSIAFTGGNNKTQTYFSYTNVGAKGIVDNNKLRRNILNLRLTNNLGEKLKLDTKITYFNENIDNRQFTGENYANNQRHALRLPRNIRTEDAMNFDYVASSGKLRQNYWNPGSNGGQNPYWIKNRVLTEDQRDRVTGFASLTYEVIPGLNVTGRAGLDRYVDKYEGKYFNDTYTIADNGNYETSWREISELNLDLFAIYDKRISPNFSVNAVVGGNRLTRNRLDQGTNNTGLNRDNLFIVTNATSPQPTRGIVQTEKQGVFATADFTFKDALTISGSVRNDWSSTLPRNNQSYFYPSVGFSAIVSNMVTLPEAVSFIKVRGTYAQTGNDASPYLLNQTYTFRPGGPNGFITRDNVKPFPDLKPELTTSLEAGIQMKFFGDRLGFDLGYYTSDSKNQLLRISTSPASGWSSEYINAGLVRNSGIELTFNATPVRTEKLRWDIDINYSANRNELITLTDQLKDYGLAGDFMQRVRAIEGRPLGELYSRGYQRNAQGQPLVDALGLPRITSGFTAYMGNSRPDWIGGIGNRISYGNLSLNFLISARIGGVVSSFTNAILYADGIPEGTLAGRESYIFPGVLEDGTPNNIATTAEKYWLRVGGRNTPAGEVFTYSASNIRLREVTLSYALPRTLTEKSPFEGASISLVGRNLFFLMNNADGFDPELTAGAQDTTVGLESFSLPSTRTVGVNLSLSF